MHYNNYPKGSQWRKWDFQVHTPASVLNSQFGDDWDKYVQHLFKKAIENEIAAIGITDYYFIDGYKRIINDYINNESKLSDLFSEDEIIRIRNILIFPNLEFRLNKLVLKNDPELTWNRKLNYHLILSNHIPIVEIEDNLIGNLKFEDISSTEGGPQEKTITKRNLEFLGKRLKREHAKFEQYTDLFVGLVNASIDELDLIKILKRQESIFGGKWLFGLPADEDLSGFPWNSQSHLIRKLLIQKSHFILSANPNTVQFCLGKKHASKQHYVQEFGAIKPCLWGSDAHDFGNMFIPHSNRYTWIKADPTFEGLMQVIYEPEERVKIQENIPEEKTPYLVIDRARFIDNTGNKVFTPQAIEFNDNLNSIIGGKSSGKSLLLYHIAKAIDNIQVAQKTIMTQSNDYADFIRENPFDFEVVWKDGEISTLCHLDEGATNQITYIPQTYINKLAEERGELQLFELIDSILKQNDDFKSVYDTKMVELEQKKNSIYNEIDSLIFLREEAKRIGKEMTEIGIREKIEAEIKRLNLKIAELRKESGFDPSENKRYELLLRKETFLEEKRSKYRFVNTSLSSLLALIKEQKRQFEHSVKKKISEGSAGELESRIVKIVGETLINNISTVFDSTIQELQDLIKKVDAKIMGIATQYDKYEESLKPFKRKIRNQQLLNSLDKELAIQKEKIAKLDGKIKERNVVVSKGRMANRQILENYSDLYEIYKDIERELQKDKYKTIFQGLELTGTLIFDTRSFSGFTDLFDQRTRFRAEFYGCFNESNEYEFNRERHYEDIRLIFDKLRDMSKLKIKLRSGIEMRDVYRNLLGDHFRFQYSVSHHGENILAMSPGKRGIVLLQLILHISNAIHPILIDQPEDNLDNRTVYEELKQFIRSKKNKRQIIMVSHNANLVVSTDSENVIVANQSGQQVGKDKREYNFEYVSGAIENTFMDETQPGILYKFGIREHVCDILEGGREAFREREKKYGFP